MSCFLDAYLWNFKTEMQLRRLPFEEAELKEYNDLNDEWKKKVYNNE